MKTTVNLTSNAQCKELFPKGTELNYIIVSQIFGAVKVGRSQNLIEDYRASSRYFPDATVVCVKVTNNRDVSEANESRLKELFASENVTRNTGKTSEVYKTDDITKFIKAL